MQDVADPTDLELVRDHLAGLKPEQLVERLVALAGRDEGLELALVTEARAAEGWFDLVELKKQLTAQLRVSSQYLHWRAVREYAARIDGVLDVLEALLEADRAAEVVLLAEHVMKRLDTLPSAGSTIPAATRRRPSSASTGSTMRPASPHSRIRASSPCACWSSR
jgi:hypothetical protein